MVPEVLHATDRDTSHGIHTALQKKKPPLLLGLAIRCTKFCENKVENTFVLINAAFST